MSDKELIKQEIERRIENLKFSIENNAFTKELKLDLEGNITTLNNLLQFINSIPEEPASKDLEEYYTKEFLPKEWFAKLGQRTISQFNFFTAQHFAEWQKQQMMKEALQTEYEKGRFDMREEMMKDAADSKITTDGNSIFPIIKYQLPLTYDCKIGDKVKLIIIKEKQQ